MRRTFRFVAISLAVTWGASDALAQHEGHTMPAQSGGQIQADQRVRASLAEIERLNMTIENARQTNDPAKMRAAIDDLESSLATIRANLLAVPPPEQTSMTPTSSGAMDHSKMAMPGTSSPPKGPPASKPSNEKEMDQMKGMDHSHMDMPGMSPAPKKPEAKNASPSKENSGQQAAPAKTRDPVCGREVETKSAEKATYKGQTYYFCSKADKEKFLADPDTYLKR